MTKIRDLLDLPKSKVMLTIPPKPPMDRSDWFNAMVKKSEGHDYLKCPWEGCEGDLLSGPRGGMSQNLKCDTCERRWNLTEALGFLERL